MTQGPQTPPTPEQLWEKLVQEAGEDEIEAACAESDEEVERYLAANGFDVEAERAKGEAFLAALVGETGPSPSTSTSTSTTGGAAVEASEAPESERDVVWEAPRRRPAGVERSYPAAGWIATAATVAMGAAAAASVVLATPVQPGHEDSDAHATRRDSPAVADAMELRGRAKVALDAWRPEECLRLLDEAKARIPGGDGAEEVVEMRQTAEKRMQVGPK